MRDILYCLVMPLNWYLVDERGHWVQQIRRKIAIVNGKPVWHDQPPNHYSHIGGKQHYAEEWPEITVDNFQRMVKKGWLEKEGELWVCSQLGLCMYRSQSQTLRAKYLWPKSIISKYRIRANKLKRRFLPPPFNQEKPEPKLPPRRPKVKHHGYRRSCQRNWLEEELDCYDPNKLPNHLR